MRILVIGGYGNFGNRLVKSLLAFTDHQIAIAGRSINKARETASKLSVRYCKNVKFYQLDVLADNLNRGIVSLAPELVVNASGPYQFQSKPSQDVQSNYAVALACLKAKCHYIDLADHRGFVSNFANAFNTQAKQLGLVFITGASTVPSLTDAIVQHFLPRFSDLTSINYGISPGNKTERGKGTIASILSYSGKSFTTFKNGSFQPIFGWQDLTRYDFGGAIGKRWMSNCDIPDLDLLPKIYPSLKSVKFQAGLEVSILHLGLSFLSFFSRIGLVKNWKRYASQLTIMSEWFSALGSHCGGMFVELGGLDKNKQHQVIKWQLVAEDGVGPNIPAIPAEILIKKLSLNKLKTGAKPCIGLFTLEEFFESANRWSIYQKEDTHVL
ncbi:MAG: saccharopine dehydrogenase [Kangiella sp.]|nr:MAG: saccharopine dehydrogenase [Kangiella sp.]